MNIQVDQEYRITSNVDCWQVERRGGKQKNGDDAWVPISYHMYFSSTLRSLAELKVRLIDSSRAEEISTTLKAIRTEITKAARVFEEVAP